MPVEKKTFRVEITACKVLEVTLTENDLERGEEFDDAASSLASECYFRNGYPDMVKVVEDWDVTIEEVKEVNHG